MGKTETQSQIEDDEDWEAQTYIGGQISLTDNMCDYLWNLSEGAAMVAPSLP